MRFRKLRAREIRPAAPAVRDARDTRRRRRAGVLFTVFLFVLGIGVAAYWFWTSQWILTRGRVVAATVAVAVTTTGRVAEVLVGEGESVVAGQVVARLDNSELHARRREAQARLAEAEIALAAAQEMGMEPDYQADVLDAESERFDAEGNAHNVKAKIDALTVDLKEARLNMERAERLYLLEVITRPEWEAAASRYRSLDAQIKILRMERNTFMERARRVDEQLQLTRENLVRGHQEQQALVDELQQRVVQAAERVAAIEASFELGEILAARDGIINSVHVVPGEVVDHNDTLMTLVDNTDRWIEAYVEADDLGYVKPGQRVTVRFDGPAGGTYEGRVVEYVSRYDNPRTQPRVGPEHVRTPLRLGSVAHPVRIVTDEALPAHIREEMIANVRIRR